MPFAVVVLNFFSHPLFDLACDRAPKRAVFAAAMAGLLLTLWWLSPGSRATKIAVAVTGAVAVAAIADVDVAEWLIDPVFVAFGLSLLAFVVAGIVVAVRGTSLRPMVVVVGWSATLVVIPWLFLTFAVCGAEGL